jgi:hypothetical protein
MHGFQARNGNSRTICAEISHLSFEIVEHNLGYATVIRFNIPDETIRMGDTLVVLEGQEIRFHGIIHSSEKDGWAVACDRRESRIPLKI